MREIGTGDKSTNSGRTHSRESAHKHKEESSSSIKSQWMGDKKKKMKKVVYYETDSSSPSTSGSELASATSKRHECKKYSTMPLLYPRISKHTPLLSVTPDFRRQTESEPCTCQDQQFTYTAVT
jgi:hypothetical protein